MWFLDSIDWELSGENERKGFVLLTEGSRLIWTLAKLVMYLSASKKEK